MGLFGCPTPFRAVTDKATANDIFPCALAPIRTGNHMINAQFLLGKGFPAVLAGVIIPGKYVSPGETNLRLWNTVVGNKHNYPGDLDQFIHKANGFVFLSNRDLRPAFVVEGFILAVNRHCGAPIEHTKGLFYCCQINRKK
jgi:hypothetical protein